MVTPKQMRLQHWSRFNIGRQEVFIAIVERLRPLDTYPKSLVWLNDPANALRPPDEFAAQYPMFAEACAFVRSIVTPQCVLDLKPANLMRRGRDIVIADPLRPA